MTRRTEFLKEMGVGPVWTLRDRPPVSDPEPEKIELAPLVNVVPNKAEAQPEDEPSFDDMPAFDDIPPMDDIPSYFVDEASFDDEPPAHPDVSGMDWDQLEETIKQCTACGLCQGRIQAVPGVGDRKAAWLFVGEGPGLSEDQQGEPFVGVSGKLLDNILLAMRLKRGNNAYIANIVKCRPTDADGKDRPPTPQEAAACRPFLDRQIALIQPKIIVTLGKTAAMSLLGTDPQTTLGALRGKTHHYVTPDGASIPLVATYHPAYLLRQLTDKRKTWEDLCLAMTICESVQTDTK